MVIQLVIKWTFLVHAHVDGNNNNNLYSYITDRPESTPESTGLN